MDTEEHVTLIMNTKKRVKGWPPGKKVNFGLCYLLGEPAYTPAHHEIAKEIGQLPLCLLLDVSS